MVAPIARPGLDGHPRSASEGDLEPIPLRQPGAESEPEGATGERPRPPEGHPEPPTVDRSGRLPGQGLFVRHDLELAGPLPPLLPGVEAAGEDDARRERLGL